MTKNVEKRHRRQQKPDISTELMMLGAVLLNMSPDSARIIARACEEIDRLRGKIAKLERAKNARK
jgi:hypothetical protein